MFAVGDLIVYSETGVCRVEQIGPPPFDPKAKREYYTLSPMNCRETIYVPVDTQVFMRPILSRAAAEELIDTCRRSSRPRWTTGIIGLWHSSTGDF